MYVTEELIKDLNIVYEEACPVEGCRNDVPLINLLSGVGCHLHRDRILVGDVEEVFEPSGFRPWGAQRMWIRRFLRNESYAMIAPTGSGKTVTAILLALYAASKLNKRSIIVLPTSTLAHQVEEKLRSYSARVNNKNVSVVGFHSLSKKPSLEELLTSDIIVTTSMSLVRNRDLFRNVKIDVAFIDDVDGFLRRSKAIDTVLDMFNITPELLQRAEELIKMKKAAKKEGYAQLIELERSVRLKDKQIIVSGATQTARRTKRVKLLSALVGFDIGKKIVGARNVADVYLYPRNGMEGELVNVVKSFGKGAFVYVQGTENVVKVANLLKENGIKAEPYIKASKRLLKAFDKGELDVLVGTASLRSSLVRGLDLPESLRYVVFLGVPKYTIEVSIEGFTPARMLVVLGSLLKYLSDEDKVEAGRIMDKLRKIMNVSRPTLEEVKRRGRARELVGDGFLGYVWDVMNESIEFFKRVTSNPEVCEKAGISGNRLVYPDPLTYVQASGRSSRLTIKGLTKGLSILIVDDDKALRALKEQLEIMDIHLRPIEEVDISNVLLEIDETRRLAKEGLRIELESILLVVESPTKAKTISSYFGHPVRRYVGNLVTYEVLTADKLLIVTSTGGHFLELDIDKFGENYGAKLEGDRLTIVFKEIEEKRGTIENLRKLAQDVDYVYVATDPDAEGEKIAWDIMAVLKPFNRSIKRVTYHEVTRKAIEEALRNPHDFDLNLLKAQILRRTEDAWLGLTLSSIVHEEFGKRWLSAGRVQTPVLGWVVSRTREAAKEKMELFSIELADGLRIPPTKFQRGTYKLLKEQGKVEIASISTETKELHPYPPYTTDTMLSDAIRILKVSSDEAMRLAQDLFETGLITYHRTDSTTVSAVGMSLAKQYLSKIGKEELYEGRPWTAEGAHECIRPTKPLSVDELELALRGKLISVQIPLTRRHLELYNLIFRRFIASQMKPVRVNYLLLTLRIAGQEHLYRMPISVEEHGFDLINPIPIVKIPEQVLSYKAPLEVAIERLSPRKLVSKKPLYDESEIVREMKAKNIGRPSTYSLIITKLRDRRYIMEIARKKLISTKLGEEVLDFLTKHFGEFVSEERTRSLLNYMDMVERDGSVFLPIIRSLWDEIESIKRKYHSLKLEKAARLN